jgi:amino acid transporter
MRGGDVVDFDSRLIDVPEASGGLARETNWWGAFVIGLAGTVLILGLIGFALVALGGFAIVLFAVITGIGVFLCFCLAEMAATWPERAGGLPSYAFETFKPLGDRFAAHVGGLSSWAYWIGWFAVAPLNAFLAAAYIVQLFSINFGGSFGPISSKFGAVVPVDVFVVGVILLLVIFVPCWLGIRLGATFATFLGIGTIVPLVLLVVLPFFKPSSLDSFDRLNFHLPAGVTGSWQLILGWSFIFTWSVLAMEAAACYIGECREPERDAKIALTAEGLFGFFIYVTLPIMVFSVLGAVGFAELAKANPGWIGDPNILFQGYIDKIFGVSTFWTWLIGLSLIVALCLSVLNAIMGASRGLYQNAQDGILPKAFGWLNKHQAPSFAMLVSLGSSIAVLSLGSPLQIYVFSNMGYLLALAISLIGYGLFRSMRENTPRQLKMPRAFGPIGLLVGVVGLLLWVVGGYYSADYAVGPGYRWLYWIGLALVALYFPLNWWRILEDRAGGGGPEPVAESSTGGSP